MGLGLGLEGGPFYRKAPEGPPEPTNPCGSVQRIHLGVGTWVPSSHSWPWAKVPWTPPPHAFLQLPASESEWGGVGAGNGEGHYMGAEEDGRLRESGQAQPSRLAGCSSPKPTGTVACTRPSTHSTVLHTDG
eukprot:superscaffoldBa00002891_g15579